MTTKQGDSLLRSLRIAWNYVQAKLHHAYPCRACGYRYDCPDGECHS